MNIKEVLVIMATFTLTKVFLVMNLPYVASLVHFNGNLHLECPSGSYQVGFTSNCTSKCPPDSPYKVSHWCMNFCPVNHSDCDNLSRLPSNQLIKTPKFRCQKYFCPFQRPFCFEYRCYRRCPDGTISDDFSCVYRCPNILPLVYNDSCKAECPSDMPYNENGVCVSECSSINVRHNKTCVRVCPDEMFLYNKTCLTVCPKETPYSIEVFNTKLCLNSCPDFTSVEGYVCKVGCPKGLEFLWNRTCVETCPGSSPQVYLIKRRFPELIPICIPNCPDNMFSDGNTCVYTCDEHMFVLNSTCIYECPSSHTLLEGPAPYSCIEQCRSHQNLNGNYCVDYCPHDKFSSNMTCVSQCPEERPLPFNGKCLSSCPNGLFNDSNKCTTYCPRYVLNQTCVPECPRHYFIRYYRDCVKFCKHFNYVYECRCSGDMLRYNDTCVEECPTQFRFVYDGNCVDKCPNSLVAYNYKCRKSCPKDAKYIYNGTCMENCQSLYQGLYAISNLLLHHEHTTTFASNSCLHACRSEKEWLEYDMKCVENCPNTTIVYGPMCRYKCSPDSLKTYKAIIHYNDNITTCVEACPDKSYQWEHYCYDHCPEHLVNYPPNGSCLHQCPDDYFRYRLRDLFRSYRVYSCNATCNKKIINNTECVYYCPSNYPLLLGQHCVSKCPVSHLLDQVNGRCLENCIPNVNFNRTCYRKCPHSSPIVLNNTCVKECPKPFNLTAPSSQGLICVNECKPPLARDGNRCTSTCQRKLIVDNVCKNITKCPDQYNFVENSTQGQICRKACPSLIFGTFCVGSCPKSHRAVESTRTCEKTCPASDPIKTDSVCLQPCSITESFSKLEQKCIPMSPGLVAAIVVTFMIAVLSIIGVFFMCKSPTIPRNTSSIPDAAAMAGESAKPQKRENTNNSVKYECATSTIHFEVDLSQHGRESDTEKQLTGETVDTTLCKTETESGHDNSGFSDLETSSNQGNDTGRHGCVYDGEMNINEETNLKEKVK